MDEGSTIMLAAVTAVTDRATVQPQNLSGANAPSTISHGQVLWITVESALLLCILCGNTLTICAVILSRRLARATSSQFVLR